MLNGGDMEHTMYSTQTNRVLRMTYLQVLAKDVLGPFMFAANTGLDPCRLERLPARLSRCCFVSSSSTLMRKDERGTLSSFDGQTHTLLFSGVGGIEDGDGGTVACL